LTGAAAGATAAYFLDNKSGRRRRALVRDQLSHARHRGIRELDAAARDLGNRSGGVLGRLRYRFGGDADDAVLEGRIRSRLGRAVSHPKSIQVQADAGCVTLEGPVLSTEVDAMMTAVSSVPGVHEVINHTRSYGEPGDVPGLQGSFQPDRRGGHWPPAIRAIVGAIGGGLLYWGFRRGGLLGIPAMFLGGGFLLRAATNLSTRRLTGIGAGRRAIDIHKTISIDAPPDDVFSLWSMPENFPRFMSHVKEIRQNGNGMTHWVVRGPAGVPIEWDAEITKSEPDRVLAWRTMPGSVVRHAGVIRFQPNDDGSTRADVQMSYNPPAGAAGHLVAQIFRSDPRQQMNDDLMRMKAFVESRQEERAFTGTAP
jgi:uncharacterized membrane protein